MFVQQIYSKLFCRPYARVRGLMPSPLAPATLSVAISQAGLRHQAQFSAVATTITKLRTCPLTEDAAHAARLAFRIVTYRINMRAFYFKASRE